MTHGITVVSGNEANGRIRGLCYEWYRFRLFTGGISRGMNAASCPPGTLFEFNA
jgi:hypothetical protein